MNATRVGIGEKWTKHLGVARVGLYSGLIAGLAAGVAARLAMRLVALEGGEPSFSLGGTLFILGMGAVLGVPLGLLFVVVRRWLPGPGPVQGLAFGVLSLLAFLGLLVPLFLGDTSNMTSEIPGGNLLLGINVFATPLVAYGLTVAIVARPIESYAERSARRTAVASAGDMVLAGIALIGTVGVVFEVAVIVGASLQAVR